MAAQQIQNTIDKLIVRQIEIITQGLENISRWTYILSEDQEKRVKTVLVTNYVSFAFTQANLASKRYATTPVHFFYFMQVFQEELIKHAIQLDIDQDNTDLTLKLSSYKKHQIDSDFFSDEFANMESLVYSTCEKLTLNDAPELAENLINTVNSGQGFIADSIFDAFSSIAGSSREPSSDTKDEDEALDMDNRSSYTTQAYTQEGTAGHIPNSASIKVAVSLFIVAVLVIFLLVN